VFHTFPRFPKGLSGLGLLASRLAASAVAPACCLLLPTSASWRVLALLSAAALIIGLLGRIAALVLAIAFTMLLPRAEGAARAFLAVNALHAIAIMLAGSGGYSLDAHLFGQRVIRVRPCGRTLV
jgi:hypothetical protein